MRSEPDGSEKNTGRVRCNIGTLFRLTTRHRNIRHDGMRVYIKKDQKGQYHGLLRIKYGVSCGPDQKFVVYTKIKR